MDREDASPLARPTQVAWPVWQRMLFRFVVSFFAVSSLYLIPANYIPGSEAILGHWSSALFRWYRAARLALFPAAEFGTLVDYSAFLGAAVVIAGVAATAWSIVDRRRLHYQRAHAWLRLYLRYFLALVMLWYGASKVIPVQFPQPPLMALITPLGQFNRTRLMWLFMGSSVPYVIFTGVFEVLGSLLLLFRRTTTLGAILLAGVLVNVLALNLFYEVGVKLPTTIYLLAALTLLAPETRRILNALLAAPNRVTVMVPDRGIRASTGLAIKLTKAAFVVWVVAFAFQRSWTNYHEASDGAPLPPLYGIYEVIVDGTGPASTDMPPATRAFRRLAISERGSVAIQDEANLMRRFDATVDTVASTILLKPWDDGQQTLQFKIAVPEPDLLVLTGGVEGELSTLRLRRQDLSTIRLRQPLK